MEIRQCFKHGTGNKTLEHLRNLDEDYRLGVVVDPAAHVVES